MGKGVACQMFLSTIQHYRHVLLLSLFAKLSLLSNMGKCLAWLIFLSTSSTLHCCHVLLFSLFSKLSFSLSLKYPIWLRDVACLMSLSKLAYSAMLTLFFYIYWLIKVNCFLNFSFLFFKFFLTKLLALTLQVKIPDCLLVVPLSFLSTPKFSSHQAEIPILSIQSIVFCLLSGYSNHMVGSTLFWVGLLVRVWVVAYSF